MSHAWRKLGLAIHVNTSVGWIGAVAAFAAVAFVGSGTADRSAMDMAAQAMAAIGWYAVVPLAVAAVASGIVQSLATGWGLARHYWVVVKLAATLVVTALLLLHMRLVDRLASSGDSDLVTLAALRHQLQFDATAGLAALIAISVFSFYKPRGVTPFGAAG